MTEGAAGVAAGGWERSFNTRPLARSLLRMRESTGAAYPQAYSAAKRPARRPNTLPDIRPEPPG